MMFILRDKCGAQPPAGLTVRASRDTPSYVDATGGKDYFFAASAGQAQELVAAGHTVVPLHDGWYEVGSGGVAVWGDGRHWEIRDTPFTVVDAST
jgi:hypothetical protein